jgi:hypothetical protein
MKLLVRRRRSDSSCTFVYPLPRVPRVALLDGRLRTTKTVRRFSPDSTGDLRDLLRYRPQAFAGTLEQLRAAANAIGPEALATFETRAVVVFTAAGSPLLTTAERDQLWSTFEAPAFEQCISARGELMASECEAHEGLHIQSIFDPDLLANVSLETRRCGCGETSPRIVPKQPDADAAAAA